MRAAARPLYPEGLRGANDLLELVPVVLPAVGERGLGGGRGYLHEWGPSDDGGPSPRPVLAAQS